LVEVVRAASDCDLRATAEKLLTEGQRHLESLPESWLSVQGWAGLGQAAVRLGRTEQGGGFFGRALAAAEKRPSGFRRRGSLEDVFTSMLGVGWVEEALAVARRGGRLSELKALAKAVGWSAKSDGEVGGVVSSKG
jgi:hypothetical protein